MDFYLWKQTVVCIFLELFVGANPRFKRKGHNWSRTDPKTTGGLKVGRGHEHHSACGILHPYNDWDANGIKILFDA